MSNQSQEPAAGESTDEAEQSQEQSQERAGAEVGMSDGEGSTFEPEEDPEGHAD